MTVRAREQKILRASLKELFESYSDKDLLVGELKSLGFIERAEKPALIVMENPSLELYIQIVIAPGSDIKSYEVLTFDEIEEALR